MTLNCSVCRNTSFHDSFPGLIKCDHCGFIMANLTISHKQIQSLYGIDYFNGDEYADYLSDKKLIQKNLSKRLDHIRKYIENGNLIEIGSAYGFFLELAKKHFFIQGYEISEEAAYYASNTLNIPTRTTNFSDDTTIKSQSIDLAVMWDVIEHLDKPEDVISKLSTVLKPKGYLFLTTGDIGSKLARFQGPSWRMIHPPTHLKYFSRETITRLLNAHGFEIVEIRYPGYWRSIKEILHGLFVLGNNKPDSLMYNLLQNFTPQRTGIYLNTYDIMFVIARLSY